MLSAAIPTLADTTVLEAFRRWRQGKIGWPLVIPPRGSIRFPLKASSRHCDPGFFASYAIGDAPRCEAIALFFRYCTHSPVGAFHAAAQQKLIMNISALGLVRAISARCRCHNLRLRLWMMRA